MKPLLLAASLLLLTTQVAAQTPCSEADPCLIAIDVDESSLTIADGQDYAVTAGDWFEFDVFNFDDVEHEIVIADLDISMQAPSLDQAIHGPWELDAPGTYTIEDLATGATATLHVVEEDVAAQPADDSHNDTPPVSIGLFAVGLLGLLFVRRK